MDRSQPIPYLDKLEKDLQPLSTKNCLEPKTQQKISAGVKAQTNLNLVLLWVPKHLDSLNVYMFYEPAVCMALESLHHDAGSNPHSFILRWLGWYINSTCSWYQAWG